ncbi:phage major capsid protein [Mycobacterium sp.]|uniref:phage major capsid protein n=1 Tax=Mycobacterium sp. TaxID=1785 RepID=UPI003D148955
MSLDLSGVDREQALARMDEIQARMEQIGAKPRASRTEDVEWGHLGDEFDASARHIDKLDRCAVIASAAREGSATLRLDRGGVDPYGDRDAQRPHSPQRDPAMRQLERSVKAGLPARSAEVVERLLDSGTDVERSWLSRWVTDTGSDAYRSAFAKLVMFGESRAALEWTAGEREAYDRVSRLKGEQRAMSLTDSAGGFLVPYELDPTINIVSAGTVNPLLDIANVKVVTTDIWHGVSSAGVQASWDAEASEVSDDSPALGEPAIPNYKLQAFVPFSVELQGDAVALVTEIGKLLSDGALQLLNTSLTTGSGTGEPTGIITALTGGSSVVNTGTGGTLAAADVYALQNSLGPRFQANGRWVGNLAVLNALRQEETTNGALKFPSLQSDTPTLLGRPVHELSVMDNTITAGKHLLVYGDFSNGYVITQRVGSSVELVPHLFGPNRRPTGQRGMLLWARYGADSINDAAFRMLQA